MTAYISIPKEIINKWQAMGDLIAEIMRVPASLIMKLEPPEITVFVSSHSESNPYRCGDKAIGTVEICCETVMRTRQRLLVPNVMQDKEGKFSCDIHRGMVSYLGFPIVWPNGEIFGTICVLDSKTNAYSELHQRLLETCRDGIEADLKFLSIVGNHFIEEPRVQSEESGKTQKERLQLLLDAEQAGKTLRASEESFKVIAKNLLDGFFWMADLRVEKTYYVSPGYERIWGRTCESLYEKPRSFVDAVHHEDREQVLATLEDENLGLPFEHEYRIIQPDGSIRWIWDRGYPVCEEAGSVSRYVGIAQDITERKKVEQELTSSLRIQNAMNEILRISLELIPLEEKFKRILELLFSIPWISLESKGSIFVLNQLSQVILMKGQCGLPEVVQTSCMEVALGQCLCGRAAATGEILFADGLDDRHETHYSGILPHGHYCVPIVSEGQTYGVINLYLKAGHIRKAEDETFLSSVARVLAGMIKLHEARDTLERRVQERTSELQATNSQLQSANWQLEDLNRRFSQINQDLNSANENMLSFLNQFEVGVVMMGANGEIMFLNKAAERVVDQSRRGAVGQPWGSFLPFKDMDKARLEEVRRLTSNQRTRVPVQWQDAKGRHYRMEIEVKDDPRDPARKIFLLYDVTELSDLRHLLDDKTQFQGICGQSRAIQSVHQNIQNVARVDTTVLIEGETGTGKELVARAIHYASDRKTKPFLAVNCAGLTESLLSSHLFGHRRGSFTGAVADQLGMFEAANHGTLFLDEIGDIPTALQTSLLRVLQEKEITRLGETQPRRIDVRIIAASHRDLSDEVASGHFREDLFYRIRVTSIRIPPLRERLEDVPLLVAWFLGQIRASKGWPVTEVSSEVLEILMQYRWPGNVRELKSAIESAVIHSNGSVILPTDLPAEVLGLSPLHSTAMQPEERTRVLEALNRVNGNRTAAARLLGVSRATLYRTMTRLGISSKE
jgi:sigma-54 dependent transcriptional regulator, acetoin dehydrogenase operon transcriptional activator AcoR